MMSNGHENYYETVSFETLFEINPDFFKFRQIRFLLQNGNIIKIKGRVNDSKTLKKLLIKHKPVKAYYMVSKFLNSSTVGAKTERELANNCFLKQDRLVFDLDENPIENAHKLLDWLKGKYEVEYILFSGQKGIHISIKRELGCNISNPLEREAWYFERNKELVAKILEAGIKIDPCITNTRQIVKIPLSISNGIVCEILKSEQIKNILIPVSAQKHNDVNHCMKQRGLNDVGTPLQPHLAFSNNIVGTKSNYCVFIKVLKEKFKEEKLKRIIKKYNLSDCYVFESENYTSVISLKAVSFKNLLNILQTNKSMHNALSKFKQNILTLEDLGKFIKIVPGIDTVAVSKGHVGLLRFLMVLTNEPKGVLVGKGDIKTATFMR